MKFTSRWEMPEVTFYQVEDHGFPAYADKPMFAYGKPGETNDHGVPKVGEYFFALDRALVAWVGEKYTGQRGAGGKAVGTAADWFMRMIGADTLVEVDFTDGRKALIEVLVATQHHNGPSWRRSNAVAAELEARGLVLATMNTH